jgi:hypothetical protein
MKLLNCRQCDDVVKLVDKTRTCECGQSTGRMVKGTGAPLEATTVSGPARVFELPWSEYDQAAGGDWQRWRMVPR